MAVGHKNYLDLPQDLRAESANRLRAQLRVSLANPAFTPEQKADIQARMAHLNRWVAGEIPPLGKAIKTP